MGDAIGPVSSRDNEMLKSDFEKQYYLFGKQYYLFQTVCFNRCIMLILKFLDQIKGWCRRACVHHSGQEAASQIRVEYCSQVLGLVRRLVRYSVSTAQMRFDCGSLPLYGYLLIFGFKFYCFCIDLHMLLHLTVL